MWWVKIDMEVKIGWQASNGNIHTAVSDWVNSRTPAEYYYGHISTWDTSQVTSMNYLRTFFLLLRQFV